MALRRGESTRKWTESPVTHLLDLELRPEPTRYGGKAKSLGRRRVSCLWLGPTLPCQGESMQTWVRCPALPQVTMWF